MTLRFGKTKLVDYDNAKVITEFPEVAVFKRMADFLNHIQTVTRIDVPGKPLLYYFKITKTDDNTVYVVWEKRDAFSGEDKPSTNYVLPWTARAAKAIDTFGKTVPLKVSDGNLEMSVSETPIFIEENK